jgi:hypothetical protein
MSPVANLSKRSRAIWSLIAAFILLSAAAPTAQGLDFPATTRLNLPETKSTSITLKRDIHFEEGAVAPVKLSEMAKVAILARQVEMSRTPYGAKIVTKTIMAEEYGWMDKQFTCLNRLWTKESNWNYLAHNYRTGAHGIPQALPAIRMEIISTDWRKNPVTQIRWGLRYIDLRYSTPCKALAKFKRSHYY